jgi:crotonobetainyl-CoA:carnitine CoA-transferase CaiB-like acyl-CoA transferase
VFRTRDDDRWLTIAVRSDEEWEGLVHLMEAPALFADPRFATASARHVNRHALHDEIETWTKTLDAAEAEQALQKAGIAAHLSCNMRDIADDKHLRDRGIIVDVSDLEGQRRAALKAPIRFSRSQIGMERGTPRLGEDEDYVFGELLSMSTEERQSLIEQQVIY